VNDLFIIGAGASAPYGFPAGEELFNEIKSLSKPANQEKFRIDLSPDVRTFYYTLNDLNKSKAISVDDLLRNNKDLGKTVKNFIARIILYYENEAKKVNKNDWIEYLCNYIDRNSSFNNFFKSKFIIFNYDRLFEHSIFNYLVNEKNRSYDIDIINNMDI
jgi:hypothetical protein